MAILENKTPSERNKIIIAAVLGALAVIALGYAFFGGSSSGPKKPNAQPIAANKPTSQAANAPVARNQQSAEQVHQDDLYMMTPIVFPQPQAAASEADRNIFSYYVAPPKPTPAPTVMPTPTPTPPPPIILASVTPTNVFARTADFTLQVSGDKFTPAVRIIFGDRELPTKFISPQQLAATVPAALIAFEGPRQISVRTPDNQLYSNTATLNVSAPPTPNFVFIGIMGKSHYNGDVAMLKDKSSKELLTVQRGDMLGGRFRVTSISEREVWLTDTNLKIKHTLAFTKDAGSGDFRPGMQPQPRPRTSDDDEEP